MTPKPFIVFWTQTCLQTLCVFKSIFVFLSFFLLKKKQKRKTNKQEKGGNNCQLSGSAHTNPRGPCHLYHVFQFGPELSSLHEVYFKSTLVAIHSASTCWSPKAASPPLEFQAGLSDTLIQAVCKLTWNSPGCLRMVRRRKKSVPWTPKADLETPTAPCLDVLGTPGALAEQVAGILFPL